MSEKRLYQANWSRGQTEGDQAEGTVRRILNMNIDGVGKAETRPGLVQHGPRQSGFGQIAFMAYSPEWSTADAWFAMLSDTKIRMTEVRSRAYAESFEYDLPISGVSSANSKLVVYSDKVFICACDSDNNPLGVMLVSSTTSTTRFRAPKYLEGTVYEHLYTESDGRWVVSLIKRDVPTLDVEQIKGFDFLDDNYAGSSGGMGVHHWPTSKINISSRYDDARTSLIEKLNDRGTGGVGLLVVAASPDEDYDGLHLPNSAYGPKASDIGPEGLYGRTMVVEFKVQYIFYGGQVSGLSNSCSVSGFVGDQVMSEAEELYNYSLGVSVIVNSGIDKSVTGVNIYRKIIDPGNAEADADSEFMLLKTVLFDSENLSSMDVSMGDIFIDKIMPSSYQNWRYGVDPITNYSLFSPVCGYRWISSWIPWGYIHVQCTDGAAWKTSGWVRVGASHLVYMEEHYGADCTVSCKEFLGAGQYLKASFSAYVASRKHGIGAELNTLIRSGADFPVAGVGTIANGYPSYVLFAMPVNGASTGTAWVAGGCGMPVDFLAVYGIRSTVSVEYLPTDSNAYTMSGESGADRLPFIGFRDIGTLSSSDNELSINGGLASDFIDAKPSSISVSAGRLLGIAGVYDGKQMPSRMWYSMYQNFGMILDGNYLDYGARDDGEGIDLSVYQGKLLIHFRSATYVVDVSGGSDMAWRELGANTGIGILNRHCVAETPIGSVWCDGAGVYIYNGRGITEISHMPDVGISVRETYLSMIDGEEDRVYTNFRQDLKQVWISVGQNVLVWDLQTGAWHEHVLSEVAVFSGGADFDIVGFFDIDGLTIAALRFVSTQPYVILFAGSGVDGYAPYEWGVDISFDAGAPEIVKKAKRYYANVMAHSDNRIVTVSVSGQGGTPAIQDLVVTAVPDFTNPDDDTMLRVSASARGRSVLMSIRNKAGSKWHGMIESLGMSHKFKALK